MPTTSALEWKRTGLDRHERPGIYSGAKREEQHHFFLDSYARSLVVENVFLQGKIIRALKVRQHDFNWKVVRRDDHIYCPISRQLIIIGLLDTLSKLWTQNNELKNQNTLL